MPVDDFIILEKHVIYPFANTSIILFELYTFIVVVLCDQLFVDNYSICLIIGLILAKEVQIISGSKLLEFKKCLDTDKKQRAKFEALKDEVTNFAEKLYMPHDVIY